VNVRRRLARLEERAAVNQSRTAARVTERIDFAGIERELRSIAVAARQDPDTAIAELDRAWREFHERCFTAG
jgi:hypothetical protein